MNKINLAFVFIAGGMVAAMDQAVASVTIPPPNTCTVLSAANDYTSAAGQGYSYEVNRYGGDGCEVMVDITQTIYTEQQYGSQYEKGIGGAMGYDHQVRLKSPLPDGVALPTSVPIHVSLAIEGNITINGSAGGGYISNLQATVGGQGYVHEGGVGSSIDYSDNFVMWVAPNTAVPVYVKGYMWMFTNAHGSTTDGQLVVDPFITIASDYAHASYFGVYQKKADGTWVELNRDWIQAVPESETWAMLLAGLGVVGMAVRRKARL